MIRLTVPSLEEDDLKAVYEVIASGFLVQGTQVAAFEKAVAKYAGVEYAVAVSSCTAALHLALLALDTRPGDMVIVPAYSFIATANVVELCGAEPVFVDIQADTFNMDPNCLESVLKRLMSAKETAGRVKAVMPVHAFGQMADMPAIGELAKRYNLPVVEDAACALGATLSGRQAGTWGTMGCFSFHPRKAITTGEGGIVVTNDDNAARRIRALRNHGQDPDASSPDFIMPGFNYRMTEFQAALGITQLSKLDRIIAARRRLAAAYDALFSDTELRIPAVRKENKSVYQSYVVLLPKNAASQRQDLIKRLKHNGIETTIGTWHMPLTTYFRTRYGYRVGDFPVADEVFSRALTLPLYERLPEQKQKEVGQFLRTALS
jgi:dTDP-4-amino-4,6-dideoxygalactose transaminase